MNDAIHSIYNHITVILEPKVNNLKANVYLSWTRQFCSVLFPPVFKSSQFNLNSELIKLELDDLQNFNLASWFKQTSWVREFYIEIMSGVSNYLHVRLFCFQLGGSAHASGNIFFF